MLVSAYTVNGTRTWRHRAITGRPQGDTGDHRAITGDTGDHRATQATQATTGDKGQHRATQEMRENALTYCFIWFFLGFSYPKNRPISDNGKG